MTRLESNEQSTNCVLMVRPACFFSNPETARTNEFQLTTDTEDLSVARAEFDAAVATLRDHGVRVIVVEDTETPETPDAVFPNNWLTTHSDGTCVMYPMQPVSRRPERRFDVIQRLREDEGFGVRHLMDWSGFEANSIFLEGTGSLVLDRVHRVAYACLSARTDPNVLAYFCEQLGYRCVSFDSVSASGKAIYHTNVMMCVGSGYAVVCLESVRDEQQRARLHASLAAHHDVVDISLEQVAGFAGNMLEVRSASGERLLVMSSTARAALNSTQREQLERHARLVQCDVSAIEAASGGSIRCMLAEIFLPRTAETVAGA